MGFFYSGGGERVVLQQARQLRACGHSVQVYAPIVRHDKCFPQLLKEIGPKEIVASFPSPIARSIGYDSMFITACRC